MLREGRDGERGVDAEVGADHRAVHDVEPVMTEDPAVGVDHAEVDKSPKGVLHVAEDLAEVGGIAQLLVGLPICHVDERRSSLSEKVLEESSRVGCEVGDRLDHLRRERSLVLREIDEGHHAEGRQRHEGSEADEQE